MSSPDPTIADARRNPSIQYDCRLFTPPLTECPACRYSFAGLPAAYRCPECGFPYDEHTVAWVDELPARAMLVGSLITLLLAFAVSWVFGDSSVVFIIVGLLVGIPITIMLPARALNKPLIAITPEGILLRRFGQAATSIPFEDLIDLKAFSGKRRVDRFYLVTKCNTFSIPIGLFVTDDARIFLAELAQARSRISNPEIAEESAGS